MTGTNGSGRASPQRSTNSHAAAAAAAAVPSSNAPLDRNAPVLRKIGFW